jgi:hypothetical protein
MRGTGAGYALYSEIIKQGKRSGASGMECLDWNTPAIDFMKNQG